MVKPSCTTCAIFSWESERLTIASFDLASQTLLQCLTGSEGDYQRRVKRPLLFWTTWLTNLLVPSISKINLNPHPWCSGRENFPLETLMQPYGMNITTV